MAQSLARLWTHLVFSTKDRFPFLSDRTRIRRTLRVGLGACRGRVDKRGLLKAEEANSHLTKKPGSIRYQLINPATNPSPKTNNTDIFCLAVVGFPAIAGNIRR